MRFVIKPERPTSREVRRVLTEQLDHAVALLEKDGASVKAVHESRKACKRARAVVALVRSGLALEDALLLNLTIRDAARAIGPVRDADVMTAKLREVGKDPEVVEDREARGRQTIALLDRARHRVASMDLTWLDRGVLREGLVRSYRDTRKRYREARKTPTGDTMHEWRKALKRHMHHLQLLTGLQPVMLESLARQVDMLQALLGDHHDTAVLAEKVDEGDALALELRAGARALEARTLALGAWLHAAAPELLEAWLAAR